MSVSNQFSTGRQYDRTLLLVADVPEQVISMDTGERIQASFNEAILSLARAAFAHGWKIAFQGRPALGILLAMTASEYLAPRSAEGDLVSQDQGEVRNPFVYYFPGHVDEVFFHAFETLESAGFVTLVRAGDMLMDRMIDETRPDALVCLGDGQVTREFLNNFRSRRREAPIFLIESTGGAVQELAREPGEDVRVFDREVLQLLERRGYFQSGKESGIGQEQSDLLPYAVIMQRLVQDLS
jgi:hypothetical protein